MFKLIKSIYSLIIKPKNLATFYFKQFFYFIYPNKINLIRKRIKYSTLPTFSQITICEGKGNVEIGSNCSFGYKLGGFHRGGSIELQARYQNSRIKIGNNVLTNNNIMICAAKNIVIGDNTLIGQYVTIIDHEAHSIDPNNRRKIGEIGEIIIGNNVWIGNNVSILKNSEIGDNSIVATGAVVTGKYPSNVIIGGVPAKIIKDL